MESLRFKKEKKFSVLLGPWYESSTFVFTTEECDASWGQMSELIPGGDSVLHSGLNFLSL